MKINIRRQFVQFELDLYIEDLNAIWTTEVQVFYEIDEDKVTVNNIEIPKLDGEAAKSIISLLYVSVERIEEKIDRAISKIERQWKAEYELSDSRLNLVDNKISVKRRSR